MFRTTITKRLGSMLAAAGLLAIAQLGVPSLAAASPSVAPTAYPPSVDTTTNVTLDHQTVNPGQKNTAHAKVSSGAGKPTGTVTFSVAGHQGTVALSPGGTADWSMPTDLQAGKTYQVTAQSNGNGVYKPSSGSTYVTVRSKPNGQTNGNGSGNGSSGGAGGSGENGGNGGGKSRPGAVLGTTQTGGTSGGTSTGGGLPGTGSDASTTLYGLGGLVLLGAGGAALAINRRRSRA